MKTSTCIAFATALLLAMTCAMSATDDAAGDGPGFEQCRPDLIEGSVEWNRDRRSRTYQDLEEELGVDKPTRERLIDILNEHWMVEHEDVNNHDMRKRADAITNMLRSVQAILGYARMDAFFVYMHGRAETYQFRSLNSQLPAEARLSPAQKAKLIGLLRAANHEIYDYRPVTWPGDADTHALAADDQALVEQLRQAEYAEAQAKKVDESNEQLERDAADFLSPVQLEAFRQLHRSAAASYATAKQSNHPPLDSARSAYIRERVSKLPRLQNPEPAAGPNTIRFTVTVDDRLPVVVTRTLASGTPTSIDVNELSVQLTPRFYGTTLFAEAKYFSIVDGERRELSSDRSSGGNSQEGSYTSTGVVAGVRQGYLVRTEVQLLQ
jgi:hypothetical protein